MIHKIIIPLHEASVAPRFDLATEVQIVSWDPEAGIRGKKTVVMPRASAEQLCHLILTESAQTVICSGIEDDYYQYLAWKKVTMIDSVIGSSDAALERFVNGTLSAGDILLS